MRVQVDRGGKAPPIKVTVKGSSEFLESELQQNDDESEFGLRSRIVFKNLFKIERRQRNTSFNP